MQILQCPLLHNWTLNCTTYSDFDKVTLRLAASQSVDLGVEPIWGSWPDIYYFLSVTVLILWGALSEERTDLSFVYAAGLHQHSLSRVRVPWDTWPYFTLSDLRLILSSPPTACSVTVEIFEPASTRVIVNWKRSVESYILGADHIENTTSNILLLLSAVCCLAMVIVSFNFCLLSVNAVRLLYSTYGKL
jgi:hypothetical protein